MKKEQGVKSNNKTVNPWIVAVCAVAGVILGTLLGMYQMMSPVAKAAVFTPGQGATEQIVLNQGSVPPEPMKKEHWYIHMSSHAPVAYAGESFPVYCKVQNEEFEDYPDALDLEVYGKNGLEVLSISKDARGVWKVHFAPTPQGNYPLFLVARDATKQVVAEWLTEVNILEKQN